MYIFGQLGEMDLYISEFLFLVFDGVCCLIYNFMLF